jgi:hypothetical protein
VQYGVVDRVEVAPDVDLEEERMAAAEPLRAGDGAVQAFAAPAGLGVEDGHALELGLDHLDDGVVQHAVAEGRCRDAAQLGIVHEEEAVAAEVDLSGGQFAAKVFELVVEVGREGADGAAVALAALSAVEGEHQVVVLRDEVVEGAGSPHGAVTWAGSAAAGGRRAGVSGVSVVSGASVGSSPSAANGGASDGGVGSEGAGGGRVRSRATNASP